MAEKLVKLVQKQPPFIIRKKKKIKLIRKKNVLIVHCCSKCILYHYILILLFLINIAWMNKAQNYSLKKLHSTELRNIWKTWKTIKESKWLGGLNGEGNAMKQPMTCRSGCPIRDCSQGILVAYWVIVFCGHAMEFVRFFLSNSLYYWGHNSLH